MWSPVPYPPEYCPPVDRVPFRTCSLRPSEVYRTDGPEPSPSDGPPRGVGRALFGGLLGLKLELQVVGYRLMPWLGPWVAQVLSQISTHVSKTNRLLTVLSRTTQVTPVPMTDL